jgi:transcriptional regulator NrdR family protein
VVFRRRRCLNCGEVFKTYEVRLDHEPGRVDFDDTEEETADST